MKEGCVDYDGWEDRTGKPRTESRSTTVEPLGGIGTQHDELPTVV